MGLLPSPHPNPPRLLVIASYRACLYGRPVPTSPRLCLAPGLVAGLGAATWPVASVLALLFLHFLLSLPSLRATSLHRKPGCR